MTLRFAPHGRWNLHGFEFDAVTLDLAGEVAVRCGARAERG
jgi:hypothetical protein